MAARGCGVSGFRGHGPASLRAEPRLAGLIPGVWAGVPLVAWPVEETAMFGLPANSVFTRCRDESGAKQP